MHVFQTMNESIFHMSEDQNRQNQKMCNNCDPMSDEQKGTAVEKIEQERFCKINLSPARNKLRRSPFDKSPAFYYAS